MDLLAVCWLQAGVLLFLVRKAASLDCEICQAVKEQGSCEGPRRTCPPVFDTCGIVVMEGKKGFNGVDKICTHSRACVQGLTRINVGKDIAVWNVLACCLGDDCKFRRPSLPDVDTTLNGKHCLASLVAKHQEFQEELIGCGGDEVYCFELSGNATTPTGASSEIKMKGCTTQAVCEHLSRGFVSIVPLGVVGRGSCEPASVAARPVPGLPGLAPLTVLLLLKGPL
ncbi:hypothetical protein lerEdw1_009595 [Lerista edwardsae]|nr:hypothetical protein lerEdw1_009595 [Lerista edwardsae]